MKTLDKGLVVSYKVHLPYNSAIPLRDSEPMGTNMCIHKDLDKNGHRFICNVQTRKLRSPPTEERMSKSWVLWTECWRPPLSPPRPPLQRLNRSCSGSACGQRFAGKGHEGRSGMMAMFCISTGVWTTQVQAFAITHWLVHLRSVHFVVCKFYLKRKKTISKYWSLINDRHTNVFK